MSGESELESLGFPPFPYNFAKPPLQASEGWIDFVHVLDDPPVVNNPFTHKKTAEFVIGNACIATNKLETDAEVRDRPVIPAPCVNVLFIVENDIPWR